MAPFIFLYTERLTIEAMMAVVVLCFRVHLVYKHILGVFGDEGDSVFQAEPANRIARDRCTSIAVRLIYE